MPLFRHPLGPATQYLVDSGLATVMTTADGRKFLQFKNPQDGINAAVQLLNTNIYKNSTIEEALRKWSGGSYGASIAPGIDPKAFIRDLPPDQMSKLLSAMQQQEGFTAGGQATASGIGSSGQIKDPTLRTAIQQLENGSTFDQVIAGFPARQAGAFRPLILSTMTQLHPDWTIAKSNLGYSSKVGAASDQQKTLSNVTAALNTADANFKLLLDTLGPKAGIKGVNDFQSPKFNSIKNSIVRDFVGSGSLNQFDSGIATLRTEYAQVLARGGEVTDSVRKEADRVIPDNISFENLKKVYDYIKQEGANVIKERQAQVDSLTGKSGNANSTDIESVKSKYGVSY